MRSMDRGFDLHPVLALLDSLSLGTQDGPTPNLTQWKAASGQRKLGDFSPLFQFLGSKGSDLHKHENNNLPSGTRTSLSSASVSPPPLMPDRSFEKIPSTIPIPQTPRQRRKLTLKKDIQAQLLPSQSPYKAREKGVEVGGKLFVWEERPVIQSNIPPHVQKAIIIQKLLSLFPQNVATLASMSILSHNPSIHIFIDNSNILIGFLDHIKLKNGYSKFARVQRPAFSFHNLSLILERGRRWQRKILVGSTPITPVITDAQTLGYECSLLEKIDKEATSPRKKSSGSSGSSSESTGLRKTVMRKGEQAVDEVLNMKVLESLLDYPPSTVVLATGDGAVGEFSEGFFKTVERALSRGWSVELVSFSSNTNKSYMDKRFRQRWGNKFIIIPLDYFVDELLG